MLTSPNQGWAIDFSMASQVLCMSFPTLNIAGRLSRECRAVEAGTCLGSERVTKVLVGMNSKREKVAATHFDNLLSSRRAIS